MALAIRSLHERVRTLRRPVPEASPYSMAWTPVRWKLR